MLVGGLAVVVEVVEEEAAAETFVAYSFICMQTRMRVHSNKNHL